MFSFELEFLKMLQERRIPFLDKLFGFITAFGEELVIVVVLAVIYFMFNKDYARRLFFAISVSMGMNGLLKNLLMIPRPFSTGEIICVRPETATGFSFPSGHSQNTSTWSTLFIKGTKNIFLRIMLVLLVLSVGFSRLYLGAHYPSDVICGIALGALIALICEKIYNRVGNKNILFFITMLAFLPFVIVFYLKANPMFSDFFKFFGMLTGLFCATAFEEKFVSLPCDGPVWKRLLRVAAAIAAAYAMKELVPLLFGVGDNLSSVVDMVEYFFVVFVSLGLCPLLFKKINI